MLRQLRETVGQREALILIYAVALLCWADCHSPFGLLPGRYYLVERGLTDAALYVGASSLLSLVILRENPLRFGLGRGDVKAWAAYSALFIGVMAVVILVVTRQVPEFAAYYPMYKPARESHSLFLLYALSTIVYMFGWEYFLRGFLLFSLARRYGNFAVVLQTVPYVLMHRGKPELELFGSIVGGLVLGVLALRTRSMWPCFLIHAFVAVWMDVCVVYVWR
jgi:membrane protease YdiL (CAAX protease family)